MEAAGVFVLAGFGEDVAVGCAGAGIAGGEGAVGGGYAVVALVGVGPSDGVAGLDGDGGGVVLHPLDADVYGGGFGRFGVDDEGEEQEWQDGDDVEGFAGHGQS